MATNRGVAYIKPGVVEVQSIPYPKLKMPKSETDPFGGKDAPHGVILKVVTTNICGSDQHMVRGRTTAPKGLILGHADPPVKSSKREATLKCSTSATW